MRSVELAKVAASAEALRLRRLARRQALRAVYGALAAVFGIALLVLIHVLLWQTAALWVSPLLATVIVLVVDVIVAGVFGMLASNSVPGPIELEAEALRHQALAELKQSLTFFGMVGQIANVAVRSGIRGGVRRSATGALAEIASRLIGR